MPKVAAAAARLPIHGGPDFEPDDRCRAHIEAEMRTDAAIVGTIIQKSLYDLYVNMI